MKRRRRRNPRLGQPDAQRPLLLRSRLWAGAIAGVVLVLFFCRGAEPVQEQVQRQVPMPATGDYQLLQRSWAGRPAAPQEDDIDPDTARMLAMRAKQWQNMDICVQGER